VKLAELVPILEWLPQYRRQDLGADVSAGLGTAVMLVPQAMGYAMLAGLPPVVGLYAALVPLVVYAAFGTSRQLAVGPVAMDSLLVAVAISGVATAGSDAYVAAALLLGVMVGIVQLALGLLRAGFLVNFLSRPVISGFTSAAALTIAFSQLTHLLGVALPTGSIARTGSAALAHASDWHLPTLLLGVASIGALLAFKRAARKLPAALIVVLAATLASVAFGLERAGVAVVGSTPRGLPSQPSLDAQLALQLLPSAFTLAFLSFMETISVGRHFARLNRYEVRPNQELGAIGLANLLGGLCGGYPVAGGLSRSAVNAAAGARTQVAALTTAAVVGLTLAFLTPLFAAMPRAVLAALILTAVLGLFDSQEPRRLWRIKRNDFHLLLFTFVATLTVGIQYGILVGVAASIALFVVRTTRPHVAVLGRIPGTEAYLNVERHPQAETFPGVCVVRIDAQFYFGNVSFLKQTLRQLEEAMPAPIVAMVLDASGINQLDSSAEGALRELDDDYHARGVKLYFAHVKGPVRDVLYRSGLLERLSSEGRIALRTHSAVCAALGQAPERPSLPAPASTDVRAPADRIGCGG
jgi:SulP family sulfate permease